jgi:CIC family chloride channel protein
MISSRKFRLPTRIGLVRLSLLAVVVGILTGIGAVVFRALISVVHNVAFFGRFSFAYDAGQYTPASPWGWGIVVVPIIGGLIVTFLVTTIAPEAGGHGVPEVMDAIYYREGLIRPIVAVVKSLSSAISIGTGASVGPEGPIMQIGGSLASSVGQIVNVAAWQRITLVAAGAGAGLAATYNTPIGGVLFAIELMLPELSARTFLPVAIATGTATYVGHIFLGLRPAFEIPKELIVVHGPASPWALLLYALLGVLMGLAATAFIRGLSLSERVFERIKNPYLRHAAGMLVVGALIYSLLVTTGQYHVEGLGDATVQATLTGGLSLWVLLALLFLAKLFATSVSLGAGASGGVFAPSVFMGAVLGGAFGAAVTAIHPVEGIGVATCAIIGMATMIGSGTGAAMAAVTMIFEMTRQYELVMPAIVAVAIAIGVRRLLSNDTIYTIKLTRRRHYIPTALHANMFLVRRAFEVMEQKFLVQSADDCISTFLKTQGSFNGFVHVVVARGDRVAGVVRINAALRHGSEDGYGGVTFGDVARRRFTVARREDVIFDVITRMAQHDASMAVVSRRRGRPYVGDIIGIISKEHIADSVAESIEPYGHSRRSPVLRTKDGVAL